MKAISFFKIRWQQHIATFGWGDGGQQKARKVSGTKKKYLEEHFVTNYVN